MIELVKELLSFLTSSEHWFTKESIINIVYYIIEIGDKLKILLDKENKKILEKGGELFINDYSEINIILIRNNKQEIHNFSERNVYISKTKESIICDKLKLLDKPDEDGYKYYILSQPTEYGMTTHAIQLSKKEAIYLNDKIKEIEI